MNSIIQRAFIVIFCQYFWQFHSLLVNSILLYYVMVSGSNRVIGVDVASGLVELRRKLIPRFIPQCPLVVLTGDISADACCGVFIRERYLRGGLSRFYIRI